MSDKGQKNKRSYKIKTASGKTHNFTARKISLNKLASKKLNVKKLKEDLEKEHSLREASDIPID
jgi:hypothetical protein